jgi:glycosyltransferase involved in cell wall biosynthesis
LRYAARSILEQSYRNLELLICDDDPDNPCLDALGPLKSDPRVRLFRSNRSQGTYNIRNNLLRHARGSLVTFHDSDDLAFPDRIENQVNYLRQNDVAGVCGQWYRVSRDGQFVFSSEHSVARIAVVSLMAPKHVFETAGPYRSAKFGADTEYYEGLRLRFGSTAVPIMQQPLIFGLSSETSLTRRAGMEATEDGYRSAARRTYAATSARSRLISWEAGRGPNLEVLETAEILVDDAGVSEEAA